MVAKFFGESYLPSRPPVYQTRDKTAQEAHEAIRPVDPWKGACNTSSDGLWASVIPYRSEDLLLAHPADSQTNDSEVHMQAIQRSLPKKLFY